MPDYPEHEKLEAVAEKSQLIGEFLEWLEGHYTLAESRQPKGRLNQELWPARVSTEELLAKYFEIDTKKLEEEKRAILEAHRRRVP